jgi:hypothetical protein
MKRGVVIIAHNTIRQDYYRMGVAVAKRAQQFLNLPTTIITDLTTLNSHGAGEYKFDHTIIVEPDRDNYLKKATWINKGRYRVYELTPYDDTLVLDTDYVINSTALLNVFDQPTDFCCYRTARYMFSDDPNEMIGPYSHSTYWATVMRFRKTERTRDLFQLIKIIQENYAYYAELHGFLPYTYRNDHALTIALRAINGHIEQPSDFIPGELQHVSGELTTVERVDDTTYNVMCEVMVRGRLKKSSITIKDSDFHMLNKENYMSLIYADTQ